MRFTVRRSILICATCALILVLIHSHMTLYRSELRTLHKSLEQSHSNGVGNSAFEPESNVKYRQKDSYLPRCPWPPRHLMYLTGGRSNISRDILTFDELEAKHWDMSLGRWRPENCRPFQKLALIVPYRDRAAPLKVFLNNVVPKLKRQNQEFTIYVAEQMSGVSFNRGMMRNVGFVEASKEDDYDCYIFHDVDIIPEDDRNLYFCSVTGPRHLSVAVDVHGYKLLYEELVGGIVAFTKEQIRKVNGYSNQFFVWGGEDDDLHRSLTAEPVFFSLRLLTSNPPYSHEAKNVLPSLFIRMQLQNMTVRRPPATVAHCSSVSHKQAKPFMDRFKVLREVNRMSASDGLNNMQYKRLLMNHRKLFRWVYVQLNDTQIMQARLKVHDDIVREALQKIRRRRVIGN